MDEACVTGKTGFEFDQLKYNETMEDFWKWALSDLRNGMVRGVLMEYLLTRQLINYASVVAGPMVLALTPYEPRSQQFKESLEESNVTQRQGDFTDLQLHWGLHFELKSTLKGSASRIARTRFYNPLTRKNSIAQHFVCPFYIFAELDGLPVFEPGTFKLNNMQVYVITGEDLETLAAPGSKNAGVGYARIFSSPLTKRCSMAQLPSRLMCMVLDRTKDVQKKLLPGWQIGWPDNKDYLPLAIEESGVVKAGYWDAKTKTLMQDYTNIWNAGEVPTWRDWEAAGFHYAVNEAAPSKANAARLSSQRRTVRLTQGKVAHR